MAPNAALLREAIDSLPRNLISGAYTKAVDGEICYCAVGWLNEFAHRKGLCPNHPSDKYEDPQEFVEKIFELEMETVSDLVDINDESDDEERYETVKTYLKLILEK